MPFFCLSWTEIGQALIYSLKSLTRYGFYNLFNSLDHILNNLLRITEDHHSFIHVEEFVIVRPLPFGLLREIQKQI
jgi:hypothetical protein